MAGSALKMPQYNSTHMDVERRFGASLRWLNSEIHGFSLPDTAKPSGASVKALSELAIAYAWLVQCRNRVSPLTNCAALQTSLELWRRFIIGECQKRPYAEAARRYPAQAFNLLVSYLALRASGYRSTYHEETLRLVHRWGYPSVTETVPYRVLNNQYFLWKSGLTRREPSWQTLYKRTILARAHCIGYLDRDDAYSITHTLFYLTDFGNHPLPLPDSEQTRIKEIVEALLVHYWRTSYWDLVGELLINLECLNMGKSVCYTGSANAFQRAWLKNGAVPPHPVESKPDHVDPRNNDKGADEDKSADERTKFFWRHYHTTLVGVLYCALTLSRQHGDRPEGPKTAAVRHDVPVLDPQVGRIRAASRRARRWLGSATAPSPEAVALRKLGILLCERITDGAPPLLAGSAPEIRFPKPEKFVVLARADLLRLAQVGAVGDRDAVHGRNQTAVWSKILGGVALSYAGSGDLSVVAALVRAAACSGVDGPWLKEALVYLLDQQQSTGCFGLLALGPSLTSTKDEIAEASMRLTVEVLWALAAARYALGTPKRRVALSSEKAHEWIGTSGGHPGRLQHRQRVPRQTQDAFCPSITLPRLHH
jgi:hypothetical protein